MYKKIGGYYTLFPDWFENGKTSLKTKWNNLPKWMKNSLFESDPKVGTGKKPKGSGRRLYTDENPNDTVHVKFKTAQDIRNTLSKSSFKSKPHARKSQIINLIHQRVRAAYGKAKDPEVRARLKRALDYIESRKEASKKKTERLRKMKEASDPQAGTALPYGSGFAPVKENDPFGLNELTRNFAKEVVDGESNPDPAVNNNNIPGWEFKDYLLSLTKFMLKQGWNIKPFPKLNIISGDYDNASKMLGMTGYYDPASKTITLFTAERHPKDIMRTYSHEMVHHMQNLENRLHHGPGTDVTKDPELLNTEDEAYEKGNTVFREWEDQLKEKNV